MEKQNTNFNSTLFHLLFEITLGVTENSGTYEADLEKRELQIHNCQGVHSVWYDA